MVSAEQRNHLIGFRPPKISTIAQVRSAQQ
jgi:hypothetical protein